MAFIILFILHCFLVIEISFSCSVSHTTRPQGSRESHGRDYYFINEATFDRALETVSEGGKGKGEGGREGREGGREGREGGGRERGEKREGYIEGRNNEV